VFFSEEVGRERLEGEDTSPMSRRNRLRLETALNRVRYRFVANEERRENWDEKKDLGDLT